METIFKCWNWLGLAALALCLVGCRPSTGPSLDTTAPHTASAVAMAPQKSTPSAEPIGFANVTEASGVHVVYRNGEDAGHSSILESLGGGAAMLDFDRDGRLDLFFATGGDFQGPNRKEVVGLPSALYRNLGTTQQAGRPVFVDVSQAAGEGFAAPHYTHGCAAGDFDNDGFDDVLVTGYGGLQLWHNLGDGTFEEIHQSAGLHDSLWSSSAGWGDVNGDGALDLYVTHYVDWSFENHPRCPGPRPGLTEICSPKDFNPLPDTVYLSQGNGMFEDASGAIGLRNDGKGLGVALGDVNLDGHLDIYVANDTTENFLYINQGAPVSTSGSPGCPSLIESARQCGVALDDRGQPNGSMGVDMGDFNLDGRPDLWVANYEIETFALYRNEGNEFFLHVSRATGITTLGGLYVGFGTAFVDVDRDGDEDLVCANGHVVKFPKMAPLLQEPFLLINEAGRRFRRWRPPPQSYFATPRAGRGLATGDLDNDGRVDLVFCNSNQPAALLRNVSADAPGAPSSAGTERPDWIRLQLVGRVSNRNGIGATLVLETSHPGLPHPQAGTRGTGTRSQLRLVTSGGSYLSTSDGRVFWGLPNGHVAERIRIRWPSGVKQTLENVSLGQTTTVVEPL